MTPVLHSLHTLVPPTVLDQDEVREVFSAQPGLSRLAKRIIATAFDGSGIRTRHTVIDELTTASTVEDPEFFDARTGLLRLPSTRTRNERYASAAETLFVEAARGALERAAGIGPEDVTHIVTVSCTGFVAPGPDYWIARDLGLRPGVQRYHLGFMGCYATMPALRAAAQFCLADPDAVVLVVSAELCTLHLRSSNDPEAIVASSLFADGIAAAVVAGREPPEGATALRLDAFETIVTPVGENAMAWTIGDNGFEMVLSTYVPHIIGEHIDSALRPLLTPAALGGDLEAGAAGSAVDHWAIHPGGRDILDRVQDRLALSDDQLAPARETLRDFGNMSSATILFVLENLLARPQTRGGDRVAAMAFGPGLTVESALLTVIRPA